MRGIESPTCSIFETYIEFVFIDLCSQVSSYRVQCPPPPHTTLKGRQAQDKRFPLRPLIPTLISMLLLLLLLLPLLLLLATAE